VVQIARGLVHSAESDLPYTSYISSKPKNMPISQYLNQLTQGLGQGQQIDESVRFHALTQAASKQTHRGTDTRTGAPKEHRFHFLSLSFSPFGLSGVSVS
jgi:hypothetical protein